MSYVIAITGAQGTGKSTLSLHIAELLTSMDKVPIQLIKGTGESASKAHIALGATADVTTIRYFANEYHQRESNIFEPFAVLDRCLLDALAYAHVLDCLTAEEFARLKADTIASTRRFNQIIWLRVTHDYPVLDPLDETPDFRRAIDAAIGQLAHDCRIELYPIELWSDDDASIVDEYVIRELESL